jgi:hypothetical protein
VLHGAWSLGPPSLAVRRTGCRPFLAKAGNTLFRLYGPLQPWYDKTWKLGEFELVK